MEIIGQFGPDGFIDIYCFFKWGIHGLFYFRSFQTFYSIKTEHFSGIQTRIDGVEGEHADHLTSTSNTGWLLFLRRQNLRQRIAKPKTEK